ncbi:unnamed protein product [Penicillium salamii]|uniref:Swiss Army Knife RNA repair protein HAD domain-containing protein n=1 Tax=Penicillium salamii TaxID=1612424 RepID=A0A9W4N4G9_9EURO|nr:unnamed protein product [Penicillium salamii]CAG8256247.1 unnamed protein product [Penicillium salamii]CAG8260274.1 unnamed protein product [Penicillium salamii]CAG8347908.1 unnamed protein product [Penicillium salamii]CAG8355747.1 unnamed protein product [Penicillium salamii]
MPSAVSQIRAIHVYDFDNTLFLSPLPNPQIWHGSSVGFLQTEDSFATGGWWHDPNILGATGKGLEAEEIRGWEGWWNDNILRLVKMSMAQKDALTVLLTGRSEAGFAETIKRMVASQDLEFDLIGLKPEVGPNGQRFATTMNFKQAFLEDLVFTYAQAEEIRVYEDRVKHVKGFRDFFESLNRSLQVGPASSIRTPILSEVIQVTEGCTYLDPVTETAEIQRMVNSHNLALRNPTLNQSKSRNGRLQIKRIVFYTGYLVTQDVSNNMTQNLLGPMLPPGLAESNDLKYMANSILITPRPASRSILDKIGGMGKKLKWQVTGTGSLDNKIWAARVAPIPGTEPFHTENPLPIVVLAVRKGARLIDAGKIQNWHPLPADKAMTFDTVIGEKVVLRVEETGDYRSGERTLNRPQKRRFQQDQDEVNWTPQHAGHEAPSHGRGNYHHTFRGGEPRYQDENQRGRGGHRGRGRGTGRGRGNNPRGRGRGRGRGDYYQYKSLDDHTNSHDGHDSRGVHGGGAASRGGYSMDY